MKETFCPSCGKETEELTEGLCTDCFKKRKTLFEIPAEIEVKKCKKCGRFKIGEEWSDTNFETAIKERTKEVIDVEKGVENFEVEVEASSKSRKREVIGRGKRKSVELKERKQTDIKLEEMTCERCSKISSGYYEAVVQIRDSGERVKDALKIAQEVIRNSKNRKAFISDFEETENGVNLLVGSKSAAKKMVKKISSQYKTERKSAKTLYGEEEGQRKYRSTYLVRILD